MESINQKQIIKFHALLNQLKLADQKREIILGFTRGRTNSSRELSKAEATTLIQRLSHDLPEEKQKRAIWGLAFKAGLLYGDTELDNKMNAAKLNKFLRENGTVKKELQEMNLQELQATHKQFEGMVSNNAKTALNKHAKQVTTDLLNELLMPVKS